MVQSIRVSQGRVNSRMSSLCRGMHSSNSPRTGISKSAKSNPVATVHSGTQRLCGLALPDPDGYQGGMPRSLPSSVAAMLLLAVSASAQNAATSSNPTATTAAPAPSPASQATPSKSYGPPPSENRYDVLSRMITPLAGVLLGGQQTSNKALVIKATVGQVAGRLPQIIKGATFTVRIEYPGRLRLEAPLFGETVTVCRDGNQAWAVPGSKIELLLSQFRHKPRPEPKGSTPLQLPFTPQQAVLLPALFQLERGNEVAAIDGVPCRVISGGLMPEVAKAVKAEDFSSKLWICSDYTPRRIDIHRSDFAMSFLIEDFSFSPSFPASTWQPPEGATDVFRCDEARLEELLYVVMNSLQMSDQDKPWLNEQAGPSSPAQGAQVPQGPSPFGPMR